MQQLTFEEVIAWLTQLIEELKAALAEAVACLAQLTSRGMTYAAQLDDLCLV